MAVSLRSGRAPVLLAATLAVLFFTMPASTQGRRERRERRHTWVNGREAAAGEVIVKFRDHVSSSRELDVEIQSDAEEVEAVGSRGLRRFKSRRHDTATLVQMLQADPDVELVEPNWVVYAGLTPNDTYFTSLWGMFNTGQSAGTAGADIDAPSAWNISTGSRTNVVGIIDTGVDFNHTDLVANMWSAPAQFTVTIGGQSIVCAAGTHGFNAINKTCNPMDDNNHGTHVAGTIGGVGNNGKGVAGVNWTASMMGLKFLGANGSGYTSDAINAIEFAVQAKGAFAASSGANIRVLNNSWGGGGFSQALLDEIVKANTKDMLFVAAAGNSHSNNDASPSYPSNYNAANVLAVAATDNKDQLASFSSYGQTTVNLAAPGVGIMSTVRNNGYSSFSGTSMATPHVAGVAALVLSKCTQSTAQLKSTLMTTVDLVPALGSVTATGGRVNAARAIQSCASNVSGLTLTTDVAAPQPAGTTVTWKANATGGAAPLQYKWFVAANGTTWAIAKNWSTSKTFLWTPTAAGSAYKIAVWVRSNGNTADTYEATTSKAFAISGVSSVTLAANKTSPQRPGTTVTWTATPAGGTAPRQYKWLVSANGTTWTTAADWSTSNTYAWTPAAAGTTYKVSLWARSAGNTLDAAEASAQASYSIVYKATAVSLSANKTSPQAPGTAIRWTATASGGAAPYQYKWYVSADGGTTWTLASGWSTSNTYTWIPTGKSNANYKTNVWARSAGNTADTYEVANSAAFAIAGVSAVTLNSNRATPQITGITTTWTATATGGSGLYRYKWYQSKNGGAWTAITGWTTSRTLQWTPATAGSYQINVWVRSVGNSTDTFEVAALRPFTMQ